MISHTFVFGDRVLGVFSRKAFAPDPSTAATDNQQNRQVVVVGLGPAGQEVVQHLVSRRMSPVAIDINPQPARMSARRFIHESSEFY